MAIRFEHVRPVIQGQWLDALLQLAPSLAEAVDRCPRHVSCPVHGGQDGFRLYRDADEKGGGICNTCGAFPDGFALLAWVNGWSLPETLAAVASFLAVDDSTIKPASRPPIKQPFAKKHKQQAYRKREALRAVWRGLMPLRDPKAKPAQNYLAGRGLANCLKALPDDLLFHPQLDYWHDGEVIGQFPVLVAVVRSLDGSAVSLHRTYISQDGSKADVPEVKKLMSPVIPGATRGAAIRLYPASDDLILAEGVETALALQLALEKPCWACITAGGLESVAIPSTVKRLIIGADNDLNKTGQIAAQNLTNRLLQQPYKLQIKTIIPEGVGADWLDVLNGEE